MPANSWLHRFTKVVNTDNKIYQYHSTNGAAKTTSQRLFYLAAYLLPGVVAYLLVNVEAVNSFVTKTLGLPGLMFQYWAFVFFTLALHMAFPILMLRYHDKLRWKDVFEFLSLNRFSFREVLIAAPIAFGLSVLVSLPYMMTLYEPIQTWFSSIPLFHIPSYSMFGSYEAFYGAPLPLMIIMLIGNFVGEEIYFRGYLMKKTSFLGSWNWLVNSLLFCAYHLWQIPQSWPLVVPFLFFGLVMQLRKNLYTMIVFHLLFNLAGVQIYHTLLGLGGLK